MSMRNEDGENIKEESVSFGLHSISTKVDHDQSYQFKSIYLDQDRYQ